MITTAHGVEVEDDILFLLDLFAILAAMISRLKNPSFQNHNIIPVSIPVPFFIQSCSRSNRGDQYLGYATIIQWYICRILQAHYDGQSLCIKRSDLYDFSDPRTLMETINKFSCFMASEPIGNTKALRKPLER
jgi:hypothetical protein